MFIMNLTLIRSMTRSAVFELENGLCFHPAHPFTVTLNGETVYESCNTNVFSLFSLLPSTTYTVGVEAEGETLNLTPRRPRPSLWMHPAMALWPTARPTTPASCRRLCPPVRPAARSMFRLAATAPQASS